MNLINTFEWASESLYFGKPDDWDNFSRAKVQKQSAKTVPLTSGYRNHYQPHSKFETWQQSANKITLDELDRQINRIYAREGRGGKLDRWIAQDSLHVLPEMRSRDFAIIFNEWNVFNQFSLTSCFLKITSINRAN